MKILTVLTYYHPHWTGLTAHAVRVAEGLAARGHQVTVLASRHEPDLSRDEIVNGVRVVRLQPVTRFSRGMLTPAFPWAVANLVRQNDVVQLHSPLPEGPLVAALAKLLNKPLLMTHHGDLVMPDGAFNQFLEWVGFRILRLTANLATAVTSYSKDYADHSRLLRPVRHKLSYVYPPVDLVEPNTAAAQAWKRELGLEGKRLIGFAGRWVREKGFDYLLQALPLIRQQIPEAHLIYAGELNVVYEDFYQRTQPLIEANAEHLTLLGLLRDPQRMAQFYAMLDLFVLPSRTDMMALVQIEAMLAGTPVVASDIPGARVVVRDTGFGQLAPPRDPVGLAETIVDTMRRAKTFLPDREGVRRVFDTETTMAEYESILLRIHQRNSGQPLAGRLPLAATGAALTRRAGRPAAGELTAEDQATLEALLRNEADMAYRRRAKILLEYLELNDGDRVLDAGCGMGFYLMAMARLRRLNLVGLDEWWERLVWARTEAVPAGLLSGDLYRLPFAGASFEAALLSEVLEHVDDEQAALSELHRVLKPGGVLAISVPHAHFPFWWDPINRSRVGLGGSPIRRGPMVGLWTNHERLYHPEELAETAAAAGFEIERLEQATHHAFPFSHFLVYGLGKPLLERNLLPAGLRRSADRFSGESNAGSLLNPFNLGRAVFRWVDHRNDQPSVEGKDRFVNVLLKARKPGGERLGPSR
jgi:glycosyltransferase involved in cell wall biosynthesis/ubiquinone/menaquinone biosynthesis C-methylase UbiE